MLQYEHFLPIIIYWLVTLFQKWMKQWKKDYLFSEYKYGKMEIYKAPNELQKFWTKLDLAFHS